MYFLPLVPALSRKAPILFMKNQKYINYWCKESFLMLKNENEKEKEKINT
jgi:hypothetical protein